MGAGVKLHAYDRHLLTRQIDEYVKQEGGYRDGAVSAEQFLSIVASEFGKLTADEFYVVWNDHSEDYDPSTNFMRAVERYYFPDRDEDSVPDEEYQNRTGRSWYGDFFPGWYGTYSEGANAEEVLAAVFESEFGYEGKFSLDEY